MFERDEGLASKPFHLLMSSLKGSLKLTTYSVYMTSADHESILYGPGNELYSLTLEEGLRELWSSTMSLAAFCERV